jgi:esterase/lipase superfamily enzyme
MVERSAPCRRFIESAVVVALTALMLVGAATPLAQTPASTSAAATVRKAAFSPILWSKQNTLGTVAFERGNYREAQTRFEEALEMARLADPRDEFLAISLNNLGETFDRQLQHDRAEALLTEALSACRGAGEERPHAATVVLLNLATTLCSRGRCGEAADYIEEARRLREAAAKNAGQKGADPWANTSAPLYLLSDSRKYAVAPIFYATDREIQNPNDPELFYGNGRGDLQLGLCEVSVPLTRRLGALPAPSWWRLEFSFEPETHVTLLQVKTHRPDDFFESVRERVHQSASRRVFVFIHGFDTTFSRVARRAAQLSYDLSFEGVPLVYCWPSRGELSEEAYIIDRQNAEWTADHLAEFLASLAKALEGENASIALISHSLGSQPLARALQRIATREEYRGLPKFDEVVFTAPDIDSGIFRRVAPDVLSISKRVTLYVSSNDRALNYSIDLHGGLPRAGHSGQGIFLMPGIDTIEVSDVDTSFIGHGYYGDNRSVLSDIYYLVTTGAPPDRRYGLTPMIRDGQRYWKFRP